MKPVPNCIIIYSNNNSHDHTKEKKRKIFQYKHKSFSQNNNSLANYSVVIRWEPFKEASSFLCSVGNCYSSKNSNFPDFLSFLVFSIQNHYSAAIACYLEYWLLFSFKFLNILWDISFLFLIYSPHMRSEVYEVVSSSVCEKLEIVLGVFYCWIC